MLLDSLVCSSKISPVLVSPLLHQSLVLSFQYQIKTRNVQILAIAKHLSWVPSHYTLHNSYRNRRLIIKITLVCGCFAVFLWNLRSSPQNMVLKLSLSMMYWSNQGIPCNSWEGDGLIFAALLNPPG